MNEAITDLARKTEKVATLITAAGKHLAEGKMVDLTALENKFRDLCRAIAEAPAGEARNLKEAIKAIIHDLDGLEVDLTDRLKDLRGEMEGTFRKKAMGAYEAPAGTPADRGAKEK